MEVIMSKVVITGLVAIHLVASLWHGSMHDRLSVNLSNGQTLFVYLVILIAPIIAAALVWTRFVSTSLWLFFLSMLGAFLFGAYYHYVMASPDNINYLPSGGPEFHHQFIVSAGLIALLELAAALYGAFCLGLRHALSVAHGEQIVGPDRR